MKLTIQDFREILDIGIQLSTEKNKNHLLSKMIHAGMDVTDCDAGTLYLYEDGALRFKIMITKSLGIDKGDNGEEIDLPPVNMAEGNVCAYSAIHGEAINIPDVYNSERFDFSGPKRYDSMTGYRTQSMLVVPLLNTEDELLGVLQLINSMDEDGNVIPFAEEYEAIVRSLSSMAATTLTNISYLAAMKQQQYSFVEAMTTAIDERTPYNGAHSRKVAEYSGLLAQYIEKKHQAGEEADSFSEDRRDRLMLSALVHDVGKMIVPLSVMNRGTRLEQEIEGIRERFKLIGAYLEIDYLKGILTEEAYAEKKQELADDLAFVEMVDGLGFLNDENYQRVQELAQKKYRNKDMELPYLTEAEIVRMSVRKGTLTAEDRVAMENHVVMTGKILSRVKFNKADRDVPKWAAEHHELLDGSGYPDHKKAEDLCLETRILTVADVYDALTSTDRPYKKPMPRERALSILRSMVEEGKMESRLVEYLAEALEARDTNISNT